MTLYLKYRPKNLDELDLPEVSEALKKIVGSKNIPHAFLFSGPKGTGKTSAARILAKIINCENLGKNQTPCDKCEQCLSITKGNNLDVVEMDAASHRGIDDVRTLRDAVKLAPTHAKKKIYIIDEAHMLTTEASNALLKTLEEPPEHVVFILATTNPEKLIETIRSRVTNIRFRKANPPEIVKSLKRVSKSEKIKASDDALFIIAEAAGGAFRDAIKILEQLIAEEKELSKEYLEEYLFRNKSFDTDRFVRLLADRNAKNLIIEIGKLGPSGITSDVFLNSLLTKLRHGLLEKIGVGEGVIKNLDRNEIVSLIELFSQAAREISDSPIEELPVELAAIKWCGEEDNRSESARLKQNSPSDKIGTGRDNLRETTSVGHGLAQTIASGARELPPDFGEKIDQVGISFTHELSSTLEVGEEVWKTILDLIKPINASIEALLRAARPLTYDGKTLTLGVYYKFHKERLEDSQHRRVLEDIVGRVLQSQTRVVCTLVAPPEKKLVTEAKEATILTEGKDQDIIKVAEEIFGN